MHKIALLIVDPQLDFCASGANGTRQGSLFVPHADIDMEVLADFVDRMGSRLSEIHVTMDSHQIVHIANPIFFKNAHEEHPAPFTQITANDVVNKAWMTTVICHTERALKYLWRLEDNKKVHTIWPPHCLIGEWGHGIDLKLAKSLKNWCEKRLSIINYVAKGSNPWTEHFSGIRAEIPDPNDPNTQTNWKLIRQLESADEIIVAGEALSHCLASTVLDIASAFKNQSSIKKLKLLTDCTSSIPGFERQVESFTKEMTAKGMGFVTTDKYV